MNRHQDVSSRAKFREVTCGHAETQLGRQTLIYPRLKTPNRHPVEFCFLSFLTMRKKKNATQKRDANQGSIVQFFKPQTPIPPKDIPKSTIKAPPQIALAPPKSVLPELDENDPRWAALNRRIASSEGVGKTMAERILRWFD